MGALNLIVWLVLCGLNTHFTDSTMLSRQGCLLDNFMTERLQVQSKQDPESFLLCLWALQWIETNHSWKSANHSAGTLFLWKQFYLIAVTRFALSRQQLLHLLFLFYKHIHMWELTSCDVGLHLNSWPAPGTAAAVQRGHAAGGQELTEQEGELLIGLNGCNQSQ